MRGGCHGCQIAQQFVTSMIGPEGWVGSLEAQLVQRELTSVEVAE